MAKTADGQDKKNERCRNGELKRFGMDMTTICA